MSQRKVINSVLCKGDSLFCVQCSMWFHSSRLCMINRKLKFPSVWHVSCSVFSWCVFWLRPAWETWAVKGSVQLSFLVRCRYRPWADKVEWRLSEGFYPSDWKASKRRVELPGPAERESSWPPKITKNNGQLTNARNHLFLALYF